MNLTAIFLTGLLTGGLTCLALQGGLLAGLINQPGTNKKFSVMIFLIAKLVAYTALGFLLGSFGAVFQFSVTTRIILQLVAVTFMIGTALNLLEVHPIFRYFVIQPPRFLTRLLRGQSSPILLGALTIFIPCGTTQAMMALAIASGNPWQAATIMFVFILGTSPVFFLLGNIFNKIGKLAAVAILVLAVFNLNGILALSGIWQNIYCTVSFCNYQTGKAETSGTINFYETGYNPNNLTLKAGSQVTLRLVNTNGRGCIQAFNIPSLNIQKIVRPGTSEEISFKTPNQPGQIPFMCSMGMYRGVINVI